jgi:SAM-dependent methyltransferase
MYAFATSLINRSPLLRRWSSRVFYQYLARLDRDGVVRLMNYGYVDESPGAQPIPLDPADEPDRCCLQLYHHVASAVDLRGRDVLEVGSGRGGGAAYLHRSFAPRSTTGVDFSDRAVAFCRDAHRHPGLDFVHGDAEALPFEDARFDAAINVESSHCYGDMGRFLAEVHRVLRPGGHLLWTDFRPPAQVGGCARTSRAAASRSCGMR